MTNDKNWGGRRPGAGRKSLRDEAAMARIVNEAVPQDVQVEILKAMVDQAKKGNARAASLILNYAYGRPLPLREDSIQSEADELNALLERERTKKWLHNTGYDLNAALAAEEEGGENPQEP